MEALELVVAKRGRSVGATVETAEVSDGAITALKLATDAVETAKIKDVNVTTGKIANDAITEAKIADSAVQLEHFNAGAHGANQVLKLNDSNDGIEFGSTLADEDSNLTINNTTRTLKEWILAL